MGEKTKELAKTRKKQIVREPAMYRVILLNDHYTTQEFVVFILQLVFRKSPAEATRIMLAVHTSGSGVAGVFPKEVAEMKILEVQQLARQDGYPLRCTLEPA